MATMEQILAETDQILQVKAAQFSKQAQEDDSGNAGERSVSGAGDDSPITRGHAVDSEQAVETPVEKAEITDNANADAEQEDTKSAETAKLANDILGNIREWQGTKVKAAQIDEGPAQPNKSDANTGVTGNPGVRNTSGAGDDSPVTRGFAVDSEQAVETPVEKALITDNANADAEQEDTKSAGGGLNMDLTQDVLAKMAAIALSFDEGVDFMGQMLEKFAGQEEAKETLDFIQNQNELAEKMAAAEQGYADGQAAVDASLYQAGLDAGTKAAACGTAHPKVKKPAAKPAAKPAVKAATPAALNLAKLAQMGAELGDASVEDLMGALPGGEGAMGAAPAEAAMGEDPMAAAMGGGMGGEMGAEGGEGEFTIDDLAAALDVLVSQGEMDPADAQAVMEYVAGGEGGEVGAEPEAPMAEEGAIAPEEAPAEVEEAPVEETPVEE